MPSGLSVFTTLKSSNGTLISYYARPREFNTGGVSATCADWMKAFAKLGVPNLVDVYMENGLEPKGTVGKKFPVKHFLNHRIFSIPIRFNFLTSKNSLVYLHEGWTLSNLAVALVCKFKKIPFAVMPHGVYDPQITKTLTWLKLRTKLEKLVIKNALFIHLYFESEAAAISAICKSAKIVIAPTGINFNEYNQLRWIGDGNYFLYAGRMDPHHKGLDLLVKAWSSLKIQEKLILAGPDYNGGTDNLKKLIYDLNLESQVFLIGNQNHSDLQILMQHARGFLHISRWESYGRSPIEAIAMGVPTLISSQMQISKIPDISNLATLSPLNLEVIAERILEISRIDPDIHNQKFNNNFIHFIKFFDWQRILKSLEEQI